MTFFTLTAVWLLLDRLTKRLLAGIDLVLIPDVLKLSTVYNTGMAFGLFQGSAIWLALSTLAAVALCFLLVRPYRPRGLAQAALGLMAGGTLGNLIDRVLYGRVTDLFELLFMDFYIFNVADVGVTVGAALLCISVFFRKKDWGKAT